MKPPPSKTGPTLTGNVGRDTCVICGVDVIRQHWSQLWMTFSGGRDCLVAQDRKHEVVKDLPRSTDRTDIEEWLDR